MPLVVDLHWCKSIVHLTHLCLLTQAQTMHIQWLKKVSQCLHVFH